MVLNGKGYVYFLHNPRIFCVDFCCAQVNVYLSYKAQILNCNHVMKLYLLYLKLQTNQYIFVAKWLIIFSPRA